MRTVLSTKILAPAQKERLLNAGLGFVEYNAINIIFSDFEIDDGYDHYIFTSQNAVKSYTKNENSERNSKINSFCVGKKTAELLKQHGFSVVETTDNAADLAQIISKKHSESRFLFLSGNKRRDELPELLKKNNIRYKEVVVYETHLAAKRFERTFDGVLFFSPSGIQSFMKQNKLGKSIAFCIGETTANEAKKHTENIVMATRPTVENVLVKAIKYFNEND